MYFRNPVFLFIVFWDVVEAVVVHPTTRYKECKQSTLGTEYTGHINVTKSGRTCQRWDSQEPIKHKFTNIATFPDFSFEEASNYCRHPDGDHDGPWCFTTFPGLRWEYCDIPECSLYPECKTTEDGFEYRGFLNRTMDGEPCLNWHTHLSNVVKKDGGRRDSLKDLTAESNYCRNPNRNPFGPWCWVTQSRRGICDVHFCKPSASCRNTAKGGNFVGTRSVTESGQMCQRWDRQIPHRHNFTDKMMFPDPTLDDAQNFCRNPSERAERPWCFTINPALEWEFCDIPVCHGCKTTTTGREYAGIISTTENGLRCQRWDTHTPHIHNMTEPERFPDANLAEANNYCRNPDNKAIGPWCFVLDSITNWGYCRIAMCTEWNAPGKGRKRVKHVVQVGVGGLRPDCISGTPGGAPNLLTRLPRQGTHTLTKARTTFRTLAMPAWGSFFCGMPLESTGIRNNEWRPPWLGSKEPITPITGKHVPMPCGFAQVKAVDATVHTAAFHAWRNLKEFFSHGIPKSLDTERFCLPVDPLGLQCDNMLSRNVTEYISNIVKTAHSSWTSLNLDVLDYVGHKYGWCSKEYKLAVDRVDDHVGAILDAIDETKESFLFMLSSDHGGHGNGHASESDVDLLVPVYLRGPSVRKNHLFSTNVRIQDIVPTGLYALGLEQNPFQLGRVMAEAFEDYTNPPCLKHLHIRYKKLKPMLETNFTKEIKNGTKGEYQQPLGKATALTIQLWRLLVLTFLYYFLST